MVFDFVDFNRIIIITLELGGVFFAGWIYFADKKSLVNKSFAIAVLSVLLWIPLCYFSGIATNNLGTSLLLARLAYGITILFFIPFFLFSIEFLKIQTSILLKVSVVISSVVIFFLTTFTDTIIAKMIPGFIGKISIGLLPVFGNSILIYFGFICLLLSLIIYQFLKKYIQANYSERIKIQYILTGLIIFIFFNLVFNIILGFIEGVPRFYYLGNYSIAFLIFFTGLAIIKQNLFGIKVVLTQMFVVLIALLLLVNFITSQTTFEYFWKGAILATFCLFGWLLIKSVVREIKQKEQLNQYADDMAKTNAELQDAYGKLEILDKAKSEFVSIASHQLRTPLTAIKGYISMMIEGDYGKISKQALQSMKNVYLANERLVKLVNSLLDMSRLESGKITLEFSPVKVDDLVADILRELRQEAKMKNLKLKMIKDKNELPKIQADPTKLRDALMNLVDNAIKYTNKGGVTVNIKYQIANLKSIIITVADTGEGMTQEEIDKLFQSFSRTDSGRKNWSEGSGLGLYIAKKFIEMHHGNIRAESPGKSQGSRFIVELPISQPN